MFAAADTHNPATIKETIMATKNTAAVLDEELETTEVELIPKQIINEGIDRVLSETGVDVQKGRYKAMRAIAFQAFLNAIADGTFDELVSDAIANVDDLPSGWEIEKAEKVDEKPARKTATKAPAKTAAKKAPAAKAAPAKAPARRRPTR